MSKNLQQLQKTIKKVTLVILLRNKKSKSLMSLAWVKDSCVKGTVACEQTPLLSGKIREGTPSPIFLFASLTVILFEYYLFLNSVVNIIIHHFILIIIIITQYKNTRRIFCWHPYSKSTPSLFFRIMSSMIGFSRVFQVLASCKKVLVYIAAKVVSRILCQVQ